MAVEQEKFSVTKGDDTRQIYESQSQPFYDIGFTKDEPVSTSTTSPVGVISSTEGITEINKQNEYLSETYPEQPPSELEAPTDPTQAPTSDGKAYFTNQAGQELQFTEEQMQDPKNQEFLRDQGYVMAKSDFAVSGDFGIGEAQGEVDEVSDKIEGLVNDFQSYNVDEDPEFKEQASGIKSQFDKMRKDMAAINHQRKRAFETLGFRSGATQYAGTIQMGVEGEELTQAGERMAEITRQENATLSAARAAAKSGKYEHYNQLVNSLKDLRAVKADKLANYSTAIVNFNNKIQRDKEFAMEEERFAMQVETYNTEKMQSRASSIGMNLVRLDENFEVFEASPEEVRQKAKEAGVDPDMLMSAMKQQAAALRKESREERGTFFDRQKFSAEQTQRDFTNGITSAREARETDIFGLTKEHLKAQTDKLTMAERGVEGGKLVKINGVDYIDTGKVDENGQTIYDVPKIPGSDKPSPLKIDALASAKALKEMYAKTKMAVGTSRMLGIQHIPGTEAATFDNLYDNVKALLSLDNIKLLKGQGQVSDAERKLLADASSKLNTAQSEEEFAKTLDTLITNLSAAMPFQPYTSFEQIYQDDDAMDMWDEVRSDPAFADEAKNNDVSALIDAVNYRLGNGYTGEKGAGQMFTAAVETKFPTGVKGGQCGTFSHKLIGYPPIGDLQAEKFAAVDKIGVKRKDWTPKIGDVVITNESKKYGHVAVVNEILPNGEIRLSESNFGLNERVSHDRTLSADSSRIYGAIRGNLYS